MFLQIVILRLLVYLQDLFVLFPVFINWQKTNFLQDDLSFAEENDIKMMKKIRSYRGVRHGMGLPVRGQRTKSNFRKNKGKVSLGVIKKKEAPKSGKSEK